MRRAVLVGLVGLLAGCNQIFGLSQAHEGQDAGSSGSNVDASCGGAAGCACVQHSDCGSMLCAFTVDPDIGQASGATCADTTTVAYVTPTGTATTGCTQTSPCGTVSQALMTKLRYIAVTGTINDNVDITSDQPVSIYGISDGAVLSASGSDVLTLAGLAADVQLADLVFSGAIAGNGVSLTGSGATLEMLRCTVENNALIGIVSTGVDAELTMTRSTIESNNVGGIDIEQGNFIFTNDFIVHNGNTGSDVGGVTVGDGAASGSRFEYNTVVANTIKSGVSLVGNGMTCLVPAATVINSIVSDNLSGSADDGVDLLGACGSGTPAEGSSFIGPDNGALDFADAAANNYRIGSASIAIGAGKMDSIVVDFDGNARPQQPMVTDQGASEFFKGSGDDHP